MYLAWSYARATCRRAHLLISSPLSMHVRQQQQQQHLLLERLRSTTSVQWFARGYLVRSSAAGPGQVLGAVRRAWRECATLVSMPERAAPALGRFAHHGSARRGVQISFKAAIYVAITWVGNYVGEEVV